MANVLGKVLVGLVVVVAVVATMSFVDLQYLKRDVGELKGLEMRKAVEEIQNTEVVPTEEATPSGSTGATGSTVVPTLKVKVVTPSVTQ